MEVCVSSEIGKLRRVLLHRPGQELEHLTPDYMESLLFDDIPYLTEAQREHDVFAEALRQNGIEVCYLENLMAETIAQNKSLRVRFIEEFISQAGAVAVNYRTELFRLLMNIDDSLELVCKTMAGVKEDEVALGSQSTLSMLVHHKAHFLLDPIPNLYFTRDPFAVIGHGVSLNRMYSVTRARETIYGKYILTHHPDYAGKVPLYYTPEMPFRIEGGDVINLSDKVLAVGVSQRTSPEAVELLARNIFADEQSAIRTVLAFDIPNLRAYMHLDTVFTQVDRTKFTVHPGILNHLRVYCLTPEGTGLHVEELHGNLDEILGKALGVERATLINCGGLDAIAAAREQWNDGSNTLCIEPGTVVVYDRNRITNAILRENGLHTIEVPSSELSRGRGGPRCMSMPLLRDAL